ncbi:MULTISPECIES: CsiV family protein [unclassified Alteromonas]|uniref:CsiV family protein n=1 Tax=unclassified Alteromonas TaxID=2614992 RepID=UPI0006896C5F|nr:MULTISPECIES: CsiV family protein [unclassified Alteromonas]
MTLFRRCTLTAVLAAFIASSLLAKANANDDWWFDVEVIAFKRNKALTELEEQFNLAESFAVPQSEADVISAVIMPDIRFIKQNLATCDVNRLPKKKPLPAWPNDLSLLVPAFDTDFLALNTPNALNELALNQTSQLDNSAYVESKGSSESTGNAFDEDDKSRDFEGTVLEETTYNGSDVEGTDFKENDFETKSERSEPTGDALAPSLETITSYWVDANWTDFFGTHSTPTVTTPQFTYCETEKPWLSVNQQPNGIKWVRHSVDNSMPAPAQLPVVIEGNDWPLATKTHLLSSDLQELTSISRQIRSNRQLERLLHVAWRQPVKFGKSKAFNVRLFGGTNYASRFNKDGEQIQDKRPAVTDTTDTMQASKEATIGVINEDEQTAIVSDAFFTSLEQRLSQPEPVSFKTLQRLETEGDLSDETTNDSGAFREPIWEIDGRMKVFLKYINRVPYLHIDSEMFYRHQVPTQYFTASDLSTELASSNSGAFVNDEGENSVLENSLSETSAQTVEYQLVSIPLAEQRRVISKQLHYFDHPLYGFIVQIRRYERPLQADTQNDKQNDTQK